MFRAMDAGQKPATPPRPHATMMQRTRRLDCDLQCAHRENARHRKEQARRARAHARAQAERARERARAHAEQAAAQAELAALTEELALQQAAFADQSSRLAEQQAAHMAEHATLLSQMVQMAKRLKEKDAALAHCVQVSEQVDLFAQRELRDADSVLMHHAAMAAAAAGAGRE